MPSTGVLPVSESTQISTDSSFRPDIQGLRAVAVGLVVVGHAGASWLSGGFVGVDVFFVISGFLITGLLIKDVAKGGVGFLKFYTRRALRILPAATLVLLATGLASMYVLNATQLSSVMKDIVWASLFGANLKFSMDGTDYFGDSEVSPLQHYWSLAVEEQFYLVWPALLAVVVGLVALMNRTRRAEAVGTGVPRAWITVALVLVTTASLWLSVTQTRTDPTTAYFSTFARAWELAAGALLAVILPWLRVLAEPVRAVLTWAGVAAIGLAAVLFDGSTPFPGTAALLPVLGAGAVLAGGIGSPRWGANRLLAIQPFRFVGDISYSLYLWHWPLLILGAVWVGGSLTTGQSVALVVAAIVLSTLSYYLVENPFRRSKKFFRNRPVRMLMIWPVAVGSVVLMAVVGSSIEPEKPSGTAVSDVAAAGPNEVRQSVLDARNGVGIPVNLTPAIADIPGDETRLNECSGYRKTSSEICQFGDPNGSKTIVVFGNSHATSWVPAVSEIAKTHHWQFFPLVKEACNYPGYAGVNRGCNQWYEWVKDQLTRIEPDVIVMNAYAHGEGWESASATVMSELKPLTHRLVVLSDPPGVGSKAVDCLQRDQVTMATCTYPVREITRERDSTQEAMSADADAEFVSVKAWFCWDGSCPSVIGNRVIYADSGHLTATYSRHLAPVLGEALALS